MIFRHGELINSVETGKPIAILTGDSRNNYLPWNIYGRRSWILVGLEESWGMFSWGNQDKELKNINRPKFRNENNIKINNETDLNSLFIQQGNSQ